MALCRDYSSVGTIITSPDGINWTKQISGTRAPLRDVTWGGDVYCAVAWGDDQFCAVGAHGRIMVSGRPHGLLPGDGLMAVR